MQYYLLLCWEANPWGLILNVLVEKQINQSINHTGHIFYHVKWWTQTPATTADQQFSETKESECYQILHVNSPLDRFQSSFWQYHSTEITLIKVLNYISLNNDSSGKKHQFYYYSLPVMWALIMVLLSNPAADISNKSPFSLMVNKKQ